MGTETRSIPRAINQYINSAYDNVMLVAENLENINKLSGVVDDITQTRTEIIPLGSTVSGEIILPDELTFADFDTFSVSLCDVGSSIVRKIENIDAAVLSEVGSVIHMEYTVTGSSDLYHVALTSTSNTTFEVSVNTGSLAGIRFMSGKVLVN